MKCAQYDRIIIGAGIYGLYAGLQSAKKNYKTLILEFDANAFSRASYINQARVHNGYHYPRSLSTAVKSAYYFDKFNQDYDFSINNAFKKIYATSAKHSWTDGEQFKKFCKAAGIKCMEIPSEKYFKPELCDGVFETEEYTYDAAILSQYFVSSLSSFPNAEIQYNVRIESIEKGEKFTIHLTDGTSFQTPFLLNATYASINQVLSLMEMELFPIKYEICEIIICDTNKALSDLGITVMDGPFFSIMPFGKTNLHSLTSVTFTPHKTSYESLPTFSCQNDPSVRCSPKQLENCNSCKNRPTTAWDYMSVLARKYLKNDINFQYKHSLFSIKPILLASEIDDSRPTVIKKFSDSPTFYSVLSGKINTIYDLDEIL